MSGRNAKLLRRYGAAKTVTTTDPDGRRRRRGPMPRGLKRNWRALTAEEKGVSRAFMLAYIANAQRDAGRRAQAAGLL